MKLRRASRSFLEPFEPAWPKDALSAEDWARRLKYWSKLRRDQSGFVFLAFLKPDLTLIGGVSLNKITYGSAQSASIGYWLGEPHAGQGLMTEAVVALVSWAFAVLGLERIEAGTVPENEKSIAVLKRVGFSEEGYARDFLEIAGRRRDHRLFGLVRRDLTRYDT